MKKIFTCFVITILAVACNNNTAPKAELKTDSTILLAPESNSNLTDTRGIFTDSSRVDSNHTKVDTLKN